MPKLHVFACPSCGASLSVEGGDATVQCQFCGNTIIVPPELRGQDDQPGRPVAAAGAMPTGRLFSETARVREIGQAIRGGNKLEAIRLYREVFDTSLEDAKNAVETLERGHSVTAIHKPTGMPITMRLDPRTYSVPGGGVGGVGAVPSSARPVVVAPSGRSSGGSIAGCIIPIVVMLVVLGIAASILVFTLPIGGDLGAQIQNVVGGVTNAYATIEMSFGGEGTGPGFFSDPRAVAVDSSGNIYVADFEDGRIQVFDSTGKYLNHWNVGDNSYVDSLAVDRNGVVYVVAGTRIRVFDGATGDELDPLDYALESIYEDVFITADGNLVAAIYDFTDDIVVFDPDGEELMYVESAISSVTGDSELDMHVAADGLGNVYALGTFNEVVFTFSPEGRFINRFGSAGDSPEQFRAPHELAIDGQGRLYVADIFGIKVFESDGRYIDTIELPGTAVAFGMTFDSSNALYVAANDHKVYKLNINRP